MKKSYAILLSCVLLIVIAAPLVSAAGIDNNVLVNAINSGVTTILNAITAAQNTILNAITNAQNNINAHTDADTSTLASAPINLILNETISVEKNKALYIQLLNESDGIVYSGHISIRVVGSQYIYVILDSDLPGTIWNVPLRDSGLKSGDSMSVDFLGSGLRMTLDNTNILNDESMEIYAVIQYTVTTS